MKTYAYLTKKGDFCQCYKLLSPHTYAFPLSVRPVTKEGPIFTVGACFENQAASLHILYLNPNLVLYIAYAWMFG